MDFLELAFSESSVVGVHTRRPYSDADLAGPHWRFRGLHHFQDFRTAEFGECHCSHAIDHSTNG